MSCWKHPCKVLGVTKKAAKCEPGLCIYVDDFVMPAGSCRMTRTSKKLQINMCNTYFSTITHTMDRFYDAIRANIEKAQRQAALELDSLKKQNCSMCLKMSDKWRKIISKHYFFLPVRNPYVQASVPTITQKRKVLESSFLYQNIYHFDTQNWLDFGLSNFRTYGSKI